MTAPIDTDPRRPLLAGARIKIRIAIACGLTLVLGAWLTPRAEQTTITAPEERPAPLLEEQVQRRETARAFEGVQDVAAQVRAHTVAIPGRASVPVTSRTDFSEPDPRPRLAGLGVFVSETHVLTHRLALDGRSAVPLALGPDGSAVDANVVAYEPASGLVLLQTATASGRTPAGLATLPPPAGALAVGVGSSGEGDIAAPVFVTRAGGSHYTIGRDDAILPGMPVFTLAGELFAIAAPDEGEVRAIPARAAVDRLLARAASGERRSSIGLGFQPPTGLLTDAFGDTGVIVTEVLGGGPADLADLQVGDLILAIGDEPADSAETLARHLGEATVGVPIRFRVRRGTRVRDIDVTPATAYEVAALARTDADAPGGPEARAVFPASVLEAAAIAPSARVLSVNGGPVTSRAQVDRALRPARRPVLVLLRHERRQFFVAIGTAP